MPAKIFYTVSMRLSKYQFCKRQDLPEFSAAPGLLYTISINNLVEIWNCWTSLGIKYTNTGSLANSEHYMWWMVQLDNAIHFVNWTAFNNS